MLLAMDSIGKYQDLSNLQSQPVFFFANAEEWGYAGSRRFARDISEGISCEANVSASDSPTGMPFCTAPIYPSTMFEKIGNAGISNILAIDQVGKLQNGQLYLHALAQSPNTFNTIINANSGIDGVTVSASSISSHIPPTPMSSFFHEFDNLKSSGVVLSGYDANFNDPLYHTRFDTGDTLVLEDIIRYDSSLFSSFYPLIDQQKYLLVLSSLYLEEMLIIHLPLIFHGQVKLLIV